jgi:hypothetical protein
MTVAVVGGLLPSRQLLQMLQKLGLEKSRLFDFRGPQDQNGSFHKTSPPFQSGKTRMGLPPEGSPTVLYDLVLTQSMG